MTHHASVSLPLSLSVFVFAPLPLTMTLSCSNIFHDLSASCPTSFPRLRPTCLSRLFDRGGLVYSTEQLNLNTRFWKTNLAPNNSTLLGAV